LRCEACGRAIGGQCGRRGLWDYCAKCNRAFCKDCMNEGCCGHTPALSGHAADKPSVLTLLLKGDFRRSFGEVGQNIGFVLTLVGSYIGIMLIGSMLLPAACNHIQP
jgi:hypothetical protein